MGEGEDERPPEFDAIVESTGLDADQVIIWPKIFSLKLIYGFEEIVL